MVWLVELPFVYHQTSHPFSPVWSWVVFLQEMKLALLVAALKFLGVESVLAVHKEAPPNPDEVPLPAVPNATWISDVWRLLFYDVL